MKLSITLALLLVVYGAAAEETSKNITAYYGEDVTITCKSEEGLKPAFTDPTKVLILSPLNDQAEDGRYSRDGNYSMVIKSIGDKDVGEWGCSYWMQGAQTYSYNVAVKPLPEVTVMTYAREPNSKVKKVASCRVTNVDTVNGYELSWNSSEALEATDDAAEVEVSSAGVVETVLKALTSEDNDERAITCLYVDTETGRTFEARSQIDIKEATTPAPTPPPQVAPSFVNVEEPEQTYELGTGAVLECNADGFPEPKVTWYKNEDPIDSVKFSNSSRTVTLTNLQYSDSGDYKCHAYNVKGSKTFHVQLQVTGKPEVVPHKDAKDKKVEIALPVKDKFVTLACSARANPTPVLTWNMDELESSDDQVETTHDVDAVNFTIGSTVKIPASKFVPTKPTAVQCHANTDLGRDTHEYVITREADTSLGGGVIAIVVIIVVFSLLLVVAALVVVVRRRRQQEVQLANENAAESGCASSLLCAAGNKPQPADEQKKAVEEEDGAVKEGLEEGAPTAGGDSPDAEEKQKLTGGATTENGEKQPLEGTAGEEEQGEEDQMLEKKSEAGDKKKKAKFGGCCVRMRSRKKIQLNEEDDEEEQGKAVAEEDAAAQDNKGADVEEEEEKEPDNEAATEDKKDHEESDRDSGKGDTLQPNVAPPQAQDDEVANDDEDSDDVHVISANNTN